MAPEGPDQRLLTALQAVSPDEAVRRLAEQLKSEGMTQLQLYRLYFRASRGFDRDDPRCEALYDTLDSIVGWCGPPAKLFAHYLTNEEIESEDEQ